MGTNKQNTNESYKSTVWRITPKHLNSGIQIVDIAAHIAGVMFNWDWSLKTMQLLDLKIGNQCNNFPKGADKTGPMHFRVNRPEQPEDSNNRAKISFLKSLKGKCMEQKLMISILIRLFQENYDFFQMKTLTHDISVSDFYNFS